MDASKRKWEKRKTVNVQFDDCTKELLLEMDMEGSSDYEDPEITSE